MLLPSFKQIQSRPTIDLFGGSGRGIDSIVTTYANNIFNAGLGTVPNSVIFTLNKFVQGCKDDGIWSKLIEVNPIIRIAGATNILGCAMSCLIVGPAGAPLNGFRWTNNGFLNSDLSVNGLTGNVGRTCFASTAMVPNITFPSANDAGLSVYISGITAAANKIDIGAFSTDGLSQFYLTANSFGSLFIGTAWKSSGADAVVAATPNLPGFYSFSRTSSTAIAGYFYNSTSGFVTLGTNSAATGAIFGTRPLAVWAATAGSGAIFDYSDDTISFVIAHHGFTSSETQKLALRCQACRIGLGGGFA